MKKSVLLTVSFFLLATHIAVGQFTKLLDFEGATNGSRPYGSLFSDGAFLYGMTESGGSKNVGTIFKIKPDGTAYTKLLDFTYADGNYPWGSLISDGTFLYGMTSQGGTIGDGTIFKIKPDGTGYEIIFDFDDRTTGSYPSENLFWDGTFLYGMTETGSFAGLGTIFKIKPDGTGYEKLLDFDGLSNGRNPRGSLISDGTFLYGMTSDVFATGTIFKIKPDGSGYQKLHDFSGGSNGKDPWGSLISDGTFLYGMTTSGGTMGLGTIFKIKPDGTGYVKLFDFEGTSNGSSPISDLISAGNFLYGMTVGGGTSGSGTIFKIKTDGTGYAKLIDFDGVLKGKSPNGSLITDGTFFYGMTNEGGTNGIGTIFKFKEIQTGINEMIISGNVSVFPNPASDYITIESEYPLNKLIIVDAIGKVVYQQNTKSSKSGIITSSLSNGIYLVKICGEGQSSQAKFIINR